jgi:hypothetical protein
MLKLSISFVITLYYEFLPTPNAMVMDPTASAAIACQARQFCIELVG